MAQMSAGGTSKHRTQRFGERREIGKFHIKTKRCMRPIGYEGEYVCARVCVCQRERERERERESEGGKVARIP